MLRNIQVVENSLLLPNTLFFSDLIDDDMEKRGMFFERLSQLSKESDLIFFDPDNGLEIMSVKKGKRKSSKYVFWDEVKNFYEKGHSVIVYQHFPRQERRKFIEIITRRADQIVSPSDIFTYSTPYVLFLLLVHPKHEVILRTNNKSIAKSWGEFMRASSRIRLSKQIDILQYMDAGISVDTNAYFEEV